MLVILELVLRGTGSGLHQHPTKANVSFDGAATPVAVAWVATVILWAPLNYFCAGTCFIFLIEFTDSDSFPCQFATFCFGWVIFMNDYSNTVIVGAPCTLRMPCCERSIGPNREGFWAEQAQSLCWINPSGGWCMRIPKLAIFASLRAVLCTFAITAWIVGL